MLPPHSTLFLYTDGLNEANNLDEQEFGMDRLEKLIADSSREEIERMADAVLETVAAFENGAHASDDKTIVVLRRR